jgi:hypothetical protein
VKTVSLGSENRFAKERKKIQAKPGHPTFLVCYENSCALGICTKILLSYICIVNGENRYIGIPMPSLQRSTMDFQAAKPIAFSSYPTSFRRWLRITKHVYTKSTTRGGGGGTLACG